MNLKPDMNTFYKLLLFIIIKCMSLMTKLIRFLDSANLDKRGLKFKNITTC